MTSHLSEETLALYSTGDLEAHELRRAAGHVDNCAQCRTSLSQYERQQQKLAGVAAEPSPEDLSEVRRRVLRVLDGRKKRVAGWQAAAAVAALAVLALLVWHREPPREVHRAQASVAAVKTPVMQAPLRAPVQKIPTVHHQRRVRAPGLRSVALVMQAGKAPLIKIATSDPGVIILLPPDTTNDERTESNDE